MTHRSAGVLALALAAALLAGCSKVSLKPEPVDVTVTVLLPGGKPARDVTVNLLPTDPGQMQGGGKADATGKLTAKLIPGKYTYTIEGTPAAMAAIPKKYQSNDAANSVEVPAGGGSLTITLTN